MPKHLFLLLYSTENSAFWPDFLSLSSSSSEMSATPPRSDNSSPFLIRAVANTATSMWPAESPPPTELPITCREALISPGGDFGDGRDEAFLS